MKFKRWNKKRRASSSSLTGRCWNKSAPVVDETVKERTAFRYSSSGNKVKDWKCFNQDKNTACEPEREIIVADSWQAGWLAQCSFMQPWTMLMLKQCVLYTCLVGLDYERKADRYKKYNLRQENATRCSVVQ